MSKIKVIKKIRKKRESQYKCQPCGKRQKVYRMFDVDGTNLVEALVCLNCGDEKPNIQS
jgi:transcription elongation factor Elf1